jgi:hypothetical protein
VTTSKTVAQKENNNKKHDECGKMAGWLELLYN